jgi:hypothetical protein
MGNAAEPGPKQADEHARDGVMSCLTGVRIMAAEMFAADVALPGLYDRSQQSAEGGRLSSLRHRLLRLRQECAS